MYFSEYKGVYFIEGTPHEATVITAVSSEINGFFTQNQLKTLDDLKEKMKDSVLSHGGNCLIEFKYGQRSRFWKSLLGMDNVLWYGSGKVGQIDTIHLEKYRQL